MALVDLEVVASLNPESLARCAAYWQAELRLQDWDLKLEIARLSELGEGTLGDCSCGSVKRQAKIRILDPRDLDGQGFWFDGEVWSWETTVVHELLHLHMHDVVKDYKTPEGLAAERAIHVISRALVAQRVR